MYQDSKIKEKMTWNKEGFTVEDQMNPDEIMEESGLNYKVEKVPAFDVGNIDALNRAIMYNDEDGLIEAANIREIPNQFSVRRTDNGKSILTNRTVTERYGICQNEDFFRIPLKMAEEGQLIIETAGEIGGGKKVFMVCRFTDMMDQDFRFSPDTPEDLVLPRISFFGSHDGTSTLKVKLIAFRMWCSNMFSALSRGDGRHINIKHTGNVTERLVGSQHLLLGMREEWIERSKVFRRMVQRPLSGEEALNVVRYVVQDKKNDREKSLDDASTRTQNRVTKLFELYRENDLGNFGNTAWDMYNAITAFNTHERTIRENHSRFDNLLNGSGADYEARGMKMLSGMIK